MEEVDMDDFGDVYADVEGSANPGVSMIPSIRQLYLEDRAKAEMIPGEVDGGLKGEERMLYDQIGRKRGPEGSSATVAAAGASRGPEGNRLSEGLGGGGDDEVAEVSNDSDSEDDLRIVLNEEDCKRFGALQRVGLGNGGVLAGACANGDEDDESAVGTGVEHPMKEQKWAESSQLPAEGLEQGGLERCGSLKNGLVMPYSQFKYVRSQSAGCPSNAKSIGQGYVIPFSSPMNLRGDWDVSGLSASPSCHIGFPVPRNRTIFDLSIESFDRKPWRNQGVDITDFFNFGLNEESWKQYCDNMVHFRKQATGMARDMIYGSIRPNQAFDSGFLCGTTSVEASLSEVACLERGATAASVVAKPKGKAIQVEGGSGERIPSVDIRRPRYQDTDVVIQIPVEGSGMEASTIPKEKTEHTDYFLLHSDNGVYGGSSKNDAVRNLSTLCHAGHKNEEAVNCDNKEHRESRGTILREPKEELLGLPDSKGLVSDKPRKMDVQVLGTTPASTDEVLHSSCPSSPESISEASKNDLSAEKLHSSAKRSSFGSVTGSDISVGGSDTSHAEVNNRANSQDLSLDLEEQRCPSETEFGGVVVEDINDSTDMDEKGPNDSDTSGRYHGKLRKRSGCNHHSGEDPASLERTKMSKNRESWKYAGRQCSMSSHTEHSCRSGLDPASNGNCHRRHNRDERRDCRHNDVKQTEHKIPKEDRNIWGMEFAIRKRRYMRCVSDHMPFCTEKDWKALHRPEKEDDHRWCVKNDIIFEDRYMKHCVERSDSKQFPYFERNEATQDEFDRNTSYRVQNKRRNPKRRERCDRNSQIEMYDAQEYDEDDGELWRYSNHRFLNGHTFRGSPSINERAWHESSPPRIYKRNSRRSSEMDVSHCGMSGARETQFNKLRQWDLMDPCTKDKYFSPYSDHCKIGGGRCKIEGRGGHAQNALFNEERKSRHVTQPRHMTEDQGSLRDEILDGSHFPEAYFSCERIYRHESSSDNHKSLASTNFLHSHSLLNEMGLRVPRKTDSIAREQNCVRHREPVSGRLNGYEGKLPGKFGQVTQKKKKVRYDKMEHSIYTDETGRRKENPGKRQKMEDHKTHVICSTVEKVKPCSFEKYDTDCNEEPDEPPVMPDQEVSGLEEGQLVESEDEDGGTEAKRWGTEEAVPISSTEVRHAHGEDKKQVKGTSNNKKPVKEYDNSHILETLAKMEKRRERFKVPIALKKELADSPNRVSQTTMIADEVKLERPARKRRWGAVKDRAT